MRQWASSIVVVVLATACSLERAGFGGGDGGAQVDAGDPVDAAVPIDGGPIDASIADAAPDGGGIPSDAGAPDAPGTCNPLACPGRICKDGACAIGASCAEIHASEPTVPSGVASIDPDGEGGQPPFDAYCEMSEDGGGWTLLLKVDGASPLFAYASGEWAAATALAGSTPDLDATQGRLAGYASMPFTEVRAGLRAGSETRWIVLPLAAPSLRALFAGKAVPTSEGREAWLSILSGSSIQPTCAVEGANVGGTGPGARVRLGIVGDDQEGCVSPDSFLGIGGQQGSISIYAGNVARANVDGRRDLVAFGYVMVR